MLTRLAALVAPRRCMICGERLLDDERSVCASCLRALPRTRFHRLPDNPVARRVFDVAVPVERATALLLYTRGNLTSRLIQHFKYDGYSDLARTLGAAMAAELLPTGFFDGVDCLVPVPLHFTRRLRRGYNQSRLLCEGIAAATALPVEEWLRSSRGHRTQTRLSGERREQNALRNRFRVSGHPRTQGRHALIVDDVCTTGATLRACIAAVHSAAPDARLSVLTLAAAGI